MNGECGRVELRLARKGGFCMDASFDVMPGAVTVLFGPSGCGKTTVLRSAAGLERAQGLVRIGNTVWQDDSAGTYVPTHKRRIGYVFQEASLFEHMTVRSNLEYGLKRIYDERGAKRLDDAVELLGISHLLDRRPAELSGGERQRCAIARSLAINPAAIFMDEPLAALDRARRLEILPWLERIKKELEVPILYVTHSEEELAVLADNVVAMRNGKVEKSGGISEMWQHIAARSGTDAALTTLMIGTVESIDAEWGMSLVRCGGIAFWIGGVKSAVGETVRIRIGADNIALSADEPGRSSVQNVFRCRVVGVLDGMDASQKTVVLNAGGTILNAAITARSVYRLGIAPGGEFWAQIKATALR